jgi:hypothetical protein
MASLSDRYVGLTNFPEEINESISPLADANMYKLTQISLTSKEL